MSSPLRTSLAEGRASTLTRELAEYARRLRFEDLTPECVEVAKHCLLDWIGVTVAGSAEPLAEILRTQVAAGDRRREATLVGPGLGRVGALDAALVNGATSHALDFDDTHSLMSGHPSVPVIPAALALAERDGGSGRELLTAIVVGIEVESRAGALFNPAHYHAGFHATGTLGILGATSAAATLLRTSEERWPHALALAATQAAGLKSSFGTMAKPLHAGKAAHDGLLAALLASEGFTGNPEILEASQGFADTHSASTWSIEDLRQYEGRFLICDTLFKYNAACYLTHSAIEGARLLREGGVASADEIEGVRILVAPSSLRVCNILEPTTGLEGKFSLRATTALSLLGDDMSDLDTYRDDRVTAPEVVALRDRITVVPEEGVSPTRSVVEVRLRDDRHAEQAVDVGKPQRDLALQRRRLSDKFAALANPHVGARAATEIVSLVGELENLPSLDALLAAATASPTRPRT